MHSEGWTHRKANQHGYWVAPMLALVLMLFGCTASRTPALVLPVTAAYRLEDIRSASRPDTTQVMITVSGPVQPLVQRLSQPDRLIIDLPETRLPPQWNQYNVPVSDGRLQMIQVTQSQPKRVQVTLALQAIQDYRIAVQSAPHRVTVELRGAVTTAPLSARTAKKSAPRAGPAEPSAQAALAQSPAHAYYLY